MSRWDQCSWGKSGWRACFQAVSLDDVPKLVLAEVVNLHPGGVVKAGSLEVFNEEADTFWKSSGN